MSTASLGWSADRRRHVLPGRLLLTVPALRANHALAAVLTGAFTGLPAVRAVRPNPLTGRVLILFDHRRTTPDEIERLLEAVAAGDAEAAPTQPKASVAPQEPPPDPEPWHAVPLPEVTRSLQTAVPRGLSQDEAARRMQQHGPNRLHSGREVSLAEVAMRQLKNPITLLLLGAGGVSLAVAQWLEALAAFGVAGLTISMAVRQETRAGHALAALSKLSAPRAVVVREGVPLTVPAEELVPGDLIILEEGDRVPADARLVFSAGLQVDESALTGESCPVIKDPNLACRPLTPLADRANMLFSGTEVVSGRAQAVVVATGMRTEVGKVATLLEEGNREMTPLQRRLYGLARWIFWGILGVAVVGTVVTMTRGMPLGQALAQAVSVAVSAMPQGLPVTVTIALSTAVARLAEQGAMTRRLGAMESIGSTTVICSDKTGTLTCNKLLTREVRTAAGVWRPGEEAELPVLRALESAALCTNATMTEHGAEGDATEAALLQAALAAGIDPERLKQDCRRLHEVPFSSEQRRMSVVCETGAGPVLIVKGAPETILPMCSKAHLGDVEATLSEADRRRWLADAEEMAGRGLRVLAVARRPQEQPVVSVEKGLTLLGYIGMADSPRPGVREAVERCREAGIRVLMLTGDHPSTAAAIGREVGILQEDSLVLSGAQLDAMTEAELAAAVDRIAICARVAPEHKLRVVRMLKRQGHVVAMTGDGVNDAPALQAADTGIAMGVAGTEVTRGAANLVLTNDDFTAIVQAIEQGRSAYGNIRRALTYSLSTNGGEALMALLPLAVGLVLPVPAAALLITNMVCDGLVSLSLATDPPEPGIMTRAPRPQGEPVLGERRVGAIALRGTAIGVSTVALYAIGVAMTGLPAIGYSMALAGLVAAKLFFARHVRREGLDGQQVTPGSNRLLDVATYLGAGVTLASIYVPALNNLFAMAPLGPQHLAVVAGVVWAQHAAATGLYRSGKAAITGSPLPAA